MTNYHTRTHLRIEHLLRSEKKYNNPDVRGRPLSFLYTPKLKIEPYYLVTKIILI